MVLFLLTARGLEDALVAARLAAFPLWINEGILASSQLEELRAEGLDITVWTYRIDETDQDGIRDATATILEHHPGHVVYAEQCLPPESVN